MADQFLGEIRIMAFNVPPKWWAQCNGQLLPINQNAALFSLLGITYGGDGRNTFALPNLQGRSPIHRSNTFPMGALGGEQSHTLSEAELPAHSHSMVASTAMTNTGSPGGAALGRKGRLGRDLFAAPANLTGLNTGMVSATGGTQAHENMQPFLTLNFCIALTGIFPSQN